MSEKKAASHATTKRWSAHVMQESDALDLPPDLFKESDPHAIALGLKHSAEHSHRRKSAPFNSAMSMLNFYINRGGRTLSKKQLAVLERAKDELRALFHRPAASKEAHD
jgi:hypothetical protein